jgi:hypothetical protein
MRGEGNLDAYLGLMDPADEVIAEDDDSAGGTDAQISIRLPETGTYIIIATRNGIDAGTTGGSYTLQITAGPPPAPTGQTTSIGGFGGLPGRSVQTDDGGALYLRGNGWTNDPAKASPLNAFGQGDLPGRSGGLKPLASVAQAQASLNVEEIRLRASQ